MTTAWYHTEEIKSDTECCLPIDHSASLTENMI